MQEELGGGRTVHGERRPSREQGHTHTLAIPLLPSGITVGIKVIHDVSSGHPVHMWGVFVAHALLVGAQRYSTCRMVMYYRDG